MSNWDGVLPAAIASIGMVFDEYARRGGDPRKLCRKELKDLLREQFGPAPDGKEAEVDKTLAELDKDGDGFVDFYEFLPFVIEMSCYFNEVIQSMCQKSE